ncbi:MAG: FG-GAP-like repeat-containing protein, partial [Acidobacteriota bacterium]
MTHGEPFDRLYERAFAPSISALAPGLDLKEDLPVRIPFPLLLTSALSLVAADLSASVPFSGETTILSLNSATEVLTGDLDGDGVPDLAALADGGGGLVYSLNGGDGSTWTTVTLASNAPRPRQIEFADIDGDGDLDLIYTDFDDDRVYRRFNNFSSGGTFGGRGNVAGISGADGVRAADLDDDGDMDLIATGRKADAYYWIENRNGLGTSWGRSTLAEDLDSPQVVAVADLDGDGDLDIAGGGSEDGGELVWLENTAGDASEWAVHAIDFGWINAIGVDD